MSDPSIDLVFAAGIAARQRGLSKPRLVTAAQAADLTPAGPPIVVVVSPETLTPDVVRAVAAVHGAGRQVLVVSGTPLDDSITAWLPAERCVIVDPHGSNIAEESEGPVSSQNALIPERLGILLDYATHADTDSVARLAGNVTAPSELLERLADHTEQVVCAAVAGNPSTPVEALKRLAASGDDIVVTALAGNTTTPAHLLKGLESSSDHAVLGALAGNPSTPTGTLQQVANMARSGDHSLLEQLGRNPVIPSSLLGEIFEEHPLDSVVPMNPSAPPELLRQLAHDQSVFWRARVAMNPNTPADVLRELASDPKVSGALYCNPGAPEELREWSLKHGTFLDPYDPEIGDWDPIDGARCAADATCSHRLLDVDASAWDRPGTSTWWRRWDGWVATVWMNPNLTADQFHRIFGPFGWEDDASIARCLLLRNPRVPPEIIERVAEEEQALPEDEGDPVVRLFTGLAMLAQPDYFSSERAEQLMLLVSRDPIALDIDDPGWDSSRLCHLETNHPSLWTRLMVDPQEWVDAARLDPVTPIPVLRLLTDTEE